MLYLLAGRLAAPLPIERHILSIVTEIELRSFRGLDAKAEAEISALLGAVEIVGLHPTLKETAIRLRRDYRLKLPDAVVAATAVDCEEELLTNDQGLIGIPGVRARAMQLSP